MHPCAAAIAEIIKVVKKNYFRVIFFHLFALQTYSAHPCAAAIAEIIKECKIKPLK